MSAILEFDFQKRKQSHFSEENYLNYTSGFHFGHPLELILFTDSPAGRGAFNPI